MSLSPRRPQQPAQRLKYGIILNPDATFPVRKKKKSREIDCQFKSRARESFPLPKNYPLFKRSWYRHISIICYLKNMSRESMCVVHAKLLQSYWTLRPYGPIRFLCPQDSPGENTGVGCHALLQIFPTEGSNPHL